MSDSQSLETLAKLFSTRRYWLRKPSGRIASINKPLPKAALEGHLKGSAGVGLCPIRPGDDTCRVAIIDMDSHKGEVEWVDMQDLAGRLMDASSHRGVRFMAFRSGGGSGIHLYAAWEAPQDARSVRAHLRSIMAVVGLEEGTAGVFEGQAELFPKQDSVPEDGAGSMVVLPYHRQSLELDPIDLDPWDAPLHLVFSDPVPVVEAVERPVREVQLDVPVEMLRSAVDFIPNTGDDELPYDTWVRAGMALHAATGGSSIGLEFFHILSMKSTKYDEKFIDERIWPYFKDRPDGITVQTLFGIARQYGFHDDDLLLLETYDEPVPALADSRGPGAAVTKKQLSDLVQHLGLECTDDGRPKGNIHNLVEVLRNPNAPTRFGYDEFLGKVMVEDSPGQWRDIEDIDYTKLRLVLESWGGFTAINTQLLIACVDMIAAENRFDSAKTWLEELVPAWDGVQRIEHFFSTYMGATSSDYTRRLGLYMWTAMAGRCLVPGIQVDSVPILVGQQGCGKSRSVQALVPDDAFFYELSFETPENDLARHIRGKLVAEIAELKGISTRAIEAIKSFVTRSFEKWIPKYKEHEVTYGRRLVFIGTTNDDEFLADATGNRRWLPVTVKACDVDRIVEDRLQLWAEAREVFKATGVNWQGLVELAADVHDQFRKRDPWEDTVAGWVFAPDPDDASGLSRAMAGVRVEDVLHDALIIDSKDQNSSSRIRVGAVLKSLGLRKARRSKSDRRQFWTTDSTRWEDGE